MDRLRYTASGRLGLWDSIPADREKFFLPLVRLLQDNAHAVIEADHKEFIPTDNPALASVTAICDKIIARGNPTLVDLDFEQTLLNGPCLPFFRVETLAEGPNVGCRLSARQIPGTMADLITAAQELLDLPFRDSVGGVFASCPLPAELRELASQEEDIFLAQFRTAFGDRLGARLHRQVLIRDLVDDPDDALAQSRVDFAFQAGGLRWVFEVDGAQHNEPGQHDLDTRRDALLTEHGWTVFRVTTVQVRQGLQTWFEDRKRAVPPALLAPGHNTVQSAIARSQLHAAAYFAILAPLATHRCLRGLLHLYSHEVLDPSRNQRILILEEDIPVTVEAFRQLHAIWDHIHTIAPETPAPPRLELDIIGDSAVHAPLSGIGVRPVLTPEGSYDIILSHGCLMDSGFIGPLEMAHFPTRPDNLIRLRHAVGFRTERLLQWCEPLRYDLADVERAITSENGDNPEPMPTHKLDAMRFFLRHIFRKRDFWDGQLRVISRLLQGKDTIVLLPTGGGKSLTYQLSGLLLPGMTIIIDPLVSLMTDQAENLEAAGIDLVGFISSQLDPAEKEASLRDMVAGRLAFTYISPERLQIQAFRNQLQTVVACFPVSLAVIDEAHCVSEWGHDFRPSYLHMPINLQRYCSDSDGDGPRPTLVGLTGTASFAVLTDIQMEMQVTDEEAIVLPKSFDRQELRFEVRIVAMAAKPAALNSLKLQMPRILRANPQHFYDLRGDRTNSGIVFCPHVNGPLGVTSVAGQLGHSNFFAGQIPKVFGRDWSKWNKHKHTIQQGFKRNRVQELVATKSFGMGIDKPNIRYTIHYAVPQSVEAFYQEAGRAGRNGIPGYALCSILYSDDNWDAALEILNEPDHQVALARLNAINWDDRGDLLVQLWLMFNSYRGRAEEKTLTLDFWNNQLAPVIAGMPAGATNTQGIPFGGDQDRVNSERAIFRLMLLGVVKDYTINWRMSRFVVSVKRISPAGVKDCLRDYLKQYKFEDFARETVGDLPEDTVVNALQAAINVLIDFIYDEIVAKRKQALRTMGELCRNFTTDQEFREAILAYLQESEFSDELREWVNRSFDAIGMDAIHDLLDRVTTLEEVKRLVGTTRRMLDGDPQNIALRYLSICARAQSAAESDASVLQETTTLALQIDRQRENLPSTDNILLSLLHDIAARRPALLASVGSIVLRRAGTGAVARMIMQSDLADNETLYSLSLKLLTANALHAATDCTFYMNLRKELRHA